MLDLEFILLSDDGKIREHNEDYLGHVAPESEDHARTHGWLFALADGVGGHEHGEVASRTAVNKIQENFKKAPASEPLATLLARLAREANVEVYETAKRTGPGGSSMATTLVACALRHDRVAVAHAGDSRCYLVRDRRAVLLTKDHKVSDGGTIALAGESISTRKPSSASTRSSPATSSSSAPTVSTTASKPPKSPPSQAVEPSSITPRSE